MSKKTLIQLPGFGDRVVLAAGEDAHTGSHKFDALLNRIAKGEEPLLTEQEKASLDDVLAGKFKRKRGQHRSDRRRMQSVHAHALLQWLRQLRAEMKRDPHERALKHELRGAYVINERVAQRAHDLLLEQKEAQQQEHGAAFVDRPLPSVASLANRLKRGK